MKKSRPELLSVAQCPCKVSSSNSIE
jgi:hypothetical protein